MLFRSNAALNPKAHLRNKITEEDVLKAMTIAAPLGLYDCSGVSDGAACAIVTTPEIARALKANAEIVTIKALEISVSNGEEASFNNWDGANIATAKTAAERAYRAAGINDPRSQIQLAEVHDCFSITELVTMEDLGLSEDGGAVRDVLDGHFDAEGRIPCQIDGGLKCFGHPIGASGIRMLYEMYLQLQGRAGARQLRDPKVGLTHNLGGQPSQNVCSVSIVGREGA